MLSKTTDALGGKGVVQSREEWSARNRVMSETLGRHINNHIQVKHSRGVDVGCQGGKITDRIAEMTGISWYGVDPTLKEARTTLVGSQIQPGWGHEMPYADNHFDCALFANVYEHVNPAQREATLAEIYRVLDHGGVLVGQLPNPRFPIESHSRLPFMGWLPFRLQKQYWKLSPMSDVWEHDFYVVTARHIQKVAHKVGFETVEIINFNYPLEVIPAAMRRYASLAYPIMKVFPWAWQFVFRKP